MNTPKAFSIPLGLAMAGIIVLSSWGALGGAAFHLTALPRPAAAGKHAPIARPDDARARFELARKLGDWAAKPQTLSEKDVKTARRAFGADGADLLRTLRRAETGR